MGVVTNIGTATSSVSTTGGASTVRWTAAPWAGTTTGTAGTATWSLQPRETKALTGPPADDVADGVMIALYPDPATAEALALPGGSPVAELHVTVAYLGKTAEVDRDTVVALCREVAERSPITGRFSGHARFTGAGDGDALVALFDSPALEDLRRDVRDLLESVGIELPGDHGYTAHCTLGYLAPTDAMPMARLEPRPATFTALAAVYGPERVAVPFIGAITATPEPAAVPEVLEVKGKGKPFAGAATPFGKGGIGGGKGPDAGPKLSTGAFVSLGKRKGRVDLVVTNGTVPGAKLPSGEEVTGTAKSPAARVVEYEAAGNGTWKSTGKKFASAVAKLKRIPPLRTRETKSLEEALAWACLAHLDEDTVAQPDVATLRRVYSRGVKSYPGGEATTLSAQQWALGRVDAFASTCAGLRPRGYHGDDDLLPAHVVEALVGTETKARGGKWSEDLHPRDSRGRFIEVGGRVRIFGGGTGTVVKNVGGGNLEIRKDSDGQTVRVRKSYLTVIDDKPPLTGTTAATPPSADVPEHVPTFAAAPDVEGVTADVPDPTDVPTAAQVTDRRPVDDPDAPPSPELGEFADAAARVAERFDRIALAGRPAPPSAGTIDDPIDVGGDIDSAAAHLAAGRHVRLNQPDEVATLLGKLREITATAKAKGVNAPTFDLCQVSVAGTNLFCAETKGIPRAQMPQLSGQAVPGSPAEATVNAKGEANIENLFRDALIARGISITPKTVPASHLRATQAELDGPKVAGMAAAMEAGKIPDAPIFVTRDNYILDGHHRWAAKLGLDTGNNTLGEVDMPVHVIDADIGAVIDFANAFALEMGIRPKGLGAAAEGVNAPTAAPRSQDVPDGTPITATPNTAEVPDAAATNASTPSTSAAATPEPGAATPAGAPAPLTDEEFQAHIVDVETKLDAALAAGMDTRSKFELMHNVWAAERSAQHDALLDELWAGYVNVPNDRKAILAGGLGGAGKTTVLNDFAGYDTNDYITINPDDLKELMAERGMIPQVEGLSPMEASALVHWEAGYLADMLAMRALREGKNVMFDGTMSWQEAVEGNLASLHAAGYTDIDGVFVRITVDEAIKRAKFRHRKGMEAHRAGQGFGGRPLPEKIIRSMANPDGSTKNEMTFNAMRPGFVNWQTWDNNVFGRDPQPEGSGESNTTTERQTAA